MINPSIIMATLHERRRAFVNQEVASKLRGQKTSKSKSSKIFRNAWKKAKREIQ